AQQQRDLVELRERLQRREHEQVIRQLENDRDHVIAEKAKNQAKLRRMEGSIQELESLVASADEIAFEHEEMDSATKAHEDLADEIHNSRPLEFFDESFEPNEAISENSNDLSLPLDDLEMESITKTVPTSANKAEPECNDESGTLDQLETKALAEFAKLSQKNSELLTELIRIKRERDDAKREASERRSMEEVSELEAALSMASGELAKTRADYDEAISLLCKMKEQREKEKARQQREDKAKQDDSDDDSNLGSPHSEAAAATTLLSSEPEGNPETSNKVSTAWKSLLKNLAHNKDSDPNPIAIDESSTKPNFSIAQEASETLEIEMIEKEMGDSWFHSRHSSKDNRSDQNIDQKESLRGSDEDPLFVSRSEVAIKKPQRIAKEILNRSEETLWHGGGQEQLTPPARLSERDSSLSQSNRVVGSTINLLEESTAQEASVKEASVEESVDRLLEKVDQNRVYAEASEDPSGSYLTYETTPRDGATSQIILTIRSLFSSCIEKTSRITLADQTVLMRYAFAFGAIAAGFVCYRLVPGQVRYLAVLMSMVLAAIYISEGVNMTRSRTSR
ncbi:MAG: hypothetical protein VXZ38_08805, partial [Planctomycetota bacterium]|nr:hypothetical protein [Planctomycetota bacterium]